MSTPVSLAQAGHDHAAAAVARVREAAEGVFEALREVRDAAVACVRPAGGARRPVAADLAALRPLLWARLRGGALPAHLPAHVTALIAGIGFIAAPGLLADAPWYLEWWQENPSGAPVRLLRNMDPASSAFYDYTHWDWYAGPSSGAERTVCGPYVDYLCTDEYSLTLSVPVVAGGSFAGVAAADVFVRRFEGAVLPALREIPGPAFLVNAEGRVVASNTASWVAGSVYRDGGSAAFSVRPVGDLPLSLVTAAG
ncbi:cache domain-containing protein [Microbispora sp. H13382]|uniref:cache domain-containing protein n=1 Tax=Microbispora sp. H13382 TaxID=2729112 RepID=UPI00160121DC|nr:cache domain-containing protein [Microbispora sp. H13382]